MMIDSVIPENCLLQINMLLTGLQGNPRDLPSVFIDTFYDVGPSEFASLKFRENTASLLEVGLEHRHPFQCKDIEIARSEIMEQQQRLRQMSLMLSQTEQEKQNLVMALEMLKHKESFHSPELHLNINF